MTASRFIHLLMTASWETFYVVVLSSLIAAVIGIPLGILSLITRPRHIWEKRAVNSILNFVINAARSVPFIIFLVAIIPFTRLIVGTSIGATAVIVPLALAASVFVARLVENALAEVPMTMVETAQAFGATRLQIIYRVLLPEALPAIINALTVTVITLIGYSAMAGVVGGGGLGDLGIRYGYQRYQWPVMLGTVILLIIAVQATQAVGDYLARIFERRRNK